MSSSWKFNAGSALFGTLQSFLVDFGYRVPNFLAGTLGVVGKFKELQNSDRLIWVKLKKLPVGIDPRCPKCVVQSTLYPKGIIC